MRQPRRQLHSQFLCKSKEHFLIAGDWEKIASLFFRLLYVYQRSHSSETVPCRCNCLSSFNSDYGSFIKRRLDTNALDIKANSINSMQNKLDASSARLDDVNGYISSPANRSFHFQSCRRQMNYQRHRALDYIASHHIWFVFACYSRPVQYRTKWLFLSTHRFLAISST